MIKIKQKGDFSKVNGYFERIKEVINMGVLDKYGRAGVEALSAATPERTGETANSWYYKTLHSGGVAKIVFCNSNINDGVPIAIILQYGHGTGTGGYVQGRDYINPAIRQIFDDLADSAWREVTTV